MNLMRGCYFSGRFLIYLVMNDPLWDLIVGIFDVGGLKITMVTKSNYSNFNAVSSFRKHANIIIIQPWMCKTHFIFYGISLGSQISNFQNCGLLNLNKALHFYAFLIVTLCKLKYSRVHFSSDKAFYKILKKPSIVQKKSYLIWKPLVLPLIKNKKLFFFEKPN